MSLHDFSNLAVQDISDEAAAMQSGGNTFFRGYSEIDGGGIRSPQDGAIFQNTSPVNSFRTFSFQHSLSPADEELDSFAIFNATGGRTFRADFFKNLTQLTEANRLGSLTLSSLNTQPLNLAPTLRNRTRAVRIFRTA